jgi:PKD repeat protein
MMKAVSTSLSVYFMFLLCAFPQNPNAKGTFIRQFKETMTPMELNHGETLIYEKENGQSLNIKLLATSANILYTNKDRISSDESRNDRGNMYRARLMYEYTAQFKINSLPMTMRRYVCSQESFFEPYVINGVRIWFIGVKDVFEECGGFLNTARSANGMPHKHARFVLQDLNSRICPGELHAWFRDDKDGNENFIYKDNFIDIGRCFNGDDCFMGAYLGGESHGALDINMAQNSFMYAPFDLDNQEGIRVNGSKIWPDGSEWRINTGHVIEKFVPDHVPVKAGEVYGLGARRACWWHPHAHFGFQIVENEIIYEIDPWIIFWQYFEDNKKENGVLRAMMKPLQHASTGEKVRVEVALESNNEANDDMEAYWSFGDGGWGTGYQAKHVYTRPGVYPVTLTLDNGMEQASFTQHVTVEGKASETPSLVLNCAEEPSFRSRPLDALDVYGWSVKHIPHTLPFLARPSRPIPETKALKVINAGGAILKPVSIGVNYINSQHFDWLKVLTEGEGNQQKMSVSVDATGLSPGTYEAIVAVHCSNALNSPQKFRVLMDVPDQPANSLGVIIDDKDEGFYCTPYFWVGHRFHGWGWPELKNAEGYKHFYLINGERPREGEFARFTPDLEKGIYDVWLYERTPFASGPPANNEPATFKVRIKHAAGDTAIWMKPERMKGFYPRPYRGQKSWAWLEPQPSRKIGTFQFEEGVDGFVEIHAGGSTGQVIVDAVRFLKRFPQ